MRYIRRPKRSRESQLAVLVQHLLTSISCSEVDTHFLELRRKAFATIMEDCLRRAFTHRGRLGDTIETVAPAEDRES